MTTGQNIIIVDDDGSVRDAMGEYLAAYGYRVRTLGGGNELYAALAERPADLVILDVMMPGESGIDICRRLAPSGQKFLMLSALGDTVDRVIGLEVGAADYLSKPFDPRELLARVNAVLRRDVLVPETGRIYEFRGWRYDVTGMGVTTAAGEVIALTRGELNVLRVLVERHGRVVPRDALLDTARGGDSDAFDRAVDLSVSRLRRKLAPHGGGDMVETVRGEGYRFVPRVRRM